MSKKSLVKNAASEKQVEKAEKIEISRREEEINDLVTVLNTASGRNVIWRFMQKCRTFGSVWEASAKIHYNSGQQDIGRYMMAEISEADPKLLFTMMQENNKEIFNG
jgi:hypothetical protein